MTLAIDSVVRRHMKSASGWAPDGTVLTLIIEPLEGETIIGVYRNPQPWETISLVFTDKALLIVEGGSVDRIAWRSVSAFDPPRSKSSGDSVFVKLSTGEQKLVRIADSYGPGGKFKDFLLLINVLLAVVRSKSPH